MYLLQQPIILMLKSRLWLQPSSINECGAKLSTRTWQRKAPLTLNRWTGWLSAFNASPNAYVTSGWKLRIETPEAVNIVDFWRPLSALTLKGLFPARAVKNRTKKRSYDDVGMIEPSAGLWSEWLSRSGVPFFWQFVLDGARHQTSGCSETKWIDILMVLPYGALCGVFWWVCALRVYRISC